MKVCVAVCVAQVKMEEALSAALSRVSRCGWEEGADLHCKGGEGVWLCHEARASFKWGGWGGTLAKLGVGAPFLGVRGVAAQVLPNC